MRKVAVIVGMLMILSTSALPAYAMGGGMGGGMSGGMGGGMGGGGMTDNFGSGLLDWFQKWRNGSAFNNSPGQDRNQMQQEDQRHDEDSAYLKYQIRMKEKELDAVLNSTDPDIEEVRALNKDIRELRAEADQEQRNYEFESARSNPAYRSGNGDGSSSYGSAGRIGNGGMGYGGRMGGYGSGR